MLSEEHLRFESGETIYCLDYIMTEKYPGYIRHIYILDQNTFYFGLRLIQIYVLYYHQSVC